ncbi:biotin-dependent carboxyltransferase family protein [Gordonia shandongensis]|uniref:5-oxoprolinase subunit C family protein n=1 Tax=Gordonia shandongensis TaxID=376351 RepID=UPI0004172892|nr:biotin-dependent carboxyltransferase family protein [Gordonia shandongensis]
MTASLTVLAPGPFSSVQDLGRPGHAHLGVPRSGGADLSSLTQANRLVGNPESAAAVETTFGGWSARVSGRVLLAVAGPTARVTVDDADVGSHAAVAVDDGAVVTVHAPIRGCRNYIAIRGGLDVAAELGSRSTDTLSGLGPPPLTAGTVLPVGADAEHWPAAPFAPVGELPEVLDLTADLGPRDDRLDDARLLAAGVWRVGAASNRIGVRLDRADGTAVPRHRRGLGELGSEGVPLGGVQVPPSGQPVVFLADHPVTGGYPVVAVLTAESVCLAAQAAPGDAARIIVR